jgi:hypothetical protein
LSDKTNWIYILPTYRLRTFAITVADSSHITGVIPWVRQTNLPFFLSINISVLSGKSFQLLQPNELIFIQTQLFSIVDVRAISGIKRPARDDRALKQPERRR